MDSMRSLNTSLPSARRRPQPPAQLLQAFKTAALQVTNLYKAAATDREQAHEEGYQAALEDMLSFLDAENLGVGDGEGWRVRQWVTEKLQEGMANNAQGLDSDDDQDDDKRARSSSPVLQRRTNPEDASATTAAAAPAVPPAPTPASISPEPAPERPAFDATLPKSDFTFRSTQPLPAPQHDQEMDGDAAELTDGSTNASAPMQINLFPRSHSHHHGRAINHRSGGGGHRSGHARNNSHRDSATAAATAAAVAQIGTNIGQGAGLKRRAPLGDFFDITGLGNGKDLFGGGGKRGRFT